MVAGDQGEGGDEVGEPLLGGQPGERQDPQPRLAREAGPGTGSTPLGTTRTCWRGCHLSAIA